MTFTGQSVMPPPHGQLVLRFADTAREYPYRLSRDGTGRRVTGAGQAVALRHGRGRVVILGEAAAWSAQVVTRPDGTTAKMGMNREGVDNAQFVLNVLHWLMGLLD
jgi:hypothetical protein